MFLYYTSKRKKQIKYKKNHQSCFLDEDGQGLGKALRKKKI